MVILILLPPPTVGLVFMCSLVYVIHSSFVYGQMVVFLSGEFFGFRDCFFGFFFELFSCEGLKNCENMK